MKKAIAITIPEPIQEKGKSYGVCTKEVIGFSKSSDEELIKKVGSSFAEESCGGQQLN
ncbi:MAG: hypothetical protein AAF489_08310 [Bacteroidota bacterium]